MDILLSVVEENIPGHIPQHVLVESGIGGGKSHCLSQIQKLLNGKKYNTVSVRQPYYMVDTADKIINVITGNGVKVEDLIILVDDFDVLLNQLNIQEQYKLRAFLFNPKSPTLIGTTTGVLEQFTNYKAPFYDAFRIFHLNNYLTPSLSVVSGRTTDASLLKYEELFNGNMHYMKQFCNLYYGEKKPAEICLQLIMKNNSTYYKYIIDSAPKLQQKVLCGLAMCGGKGTSRDIGSKINLTNSFVSPALKRLETSQIIKKANNGKRNIVYEFKDGIFRLFWKNMLNTNLCS